MLTISAVPLTLRVRLGALVSAVLLAPLLGAGVCLGFDALLRPRAGSAGLAWHHAALVGGVVFVVEVVIGVLAWPLVRYTDRQGRLLSLMVRDRGVWHARVRREADETREKALGRLSSAFAHDMNNVLGAILASVDAVEDASDDPGVRAATASIVDSVQAGLHIGKRILTFGESIALFPKTADLNAQLLNAKDRLVSAAGGRARLVFRLGHRPLPIDVDQDHLLACVVELVENARAATPNESQIAVRTRTEFGDDRQRPDALVAVLEIEDAGRGMDDHEIARATSPFYTTKPGGLGLGLAMAARFVEASRGTLLIQSRPGRGTRVTLRFPVAEAAAERAPPPLPPPLLQETLDGGAKARILVVDDNAAMRTGIARGLQRLGFAVSEGEDAASARAAIERGVDALITDVVLPDMDGFALARHARIRDPSVALVFMSGFISARQPELLANDELATFMRKPIDLDKLADVLAGLLAAREDLPVRTLRA